MTERNRSVFRFSSVEVHEWEGRLKRAGQLLPVEPKGFRVLVYLLRNPGRLVPKNELLNAGWGETAATENSLTRNIALLRRLLEDETRAPRYIETVSTAGYRFICSNMWRSQTTANRSRIRLIRRDPLEEHRIGIEPSP
jgi:DNA-binding winged helix-turn-helix (wHTH) protein